MTTACVILGGLGKQESYRPLAADLKLGDRAYLIGDAAGQIAEALDVAHVPYLHCGELTTAVREAAAAASRARSCCCRRPVRASTSSTTTRRAARRSVGSCSSCVVAAGRSGATLVSPPRDLQDRQPVAADAQVGA